MGQRYPMDFVRWAIGTRCRMDSSLNDVYKLPRSVQSISVATDGPLDVFLIVYQIRLWRI